MPFSDPWPKQILEIQLFGLGASFNGESRGHSAHQGEGQGSFFVGKDNVLSEGQGAGSIRFLCQNPLRDEQLHVLVHGDFADAQGVRQLLHGR
jgi:hypothetical protein